MPNELRIAYFPGVHLKQRLDHEFIVFIIILNLYPCPFQRQQSQFGKSFLNNSKYAQTKQTGSILYEERVVTITLTAHACLTLYETEFCL